MPQETAARRKKCNEPFGEVARGHLHDSAKGRSDAESRHVSG
jgi:hypothetical protein